MAGDPPICRAPAAGKDNQKQAARGRAQLAFRTASCPGGTRVFPARRARGRTLRLGRVYEMRAVTGQKVGQFDRKGKARGSGRGSGRIWGGQGRISMCEARRPLGWCTGGALSRRMLQRRSGSTLGPASDDSRAVTRRGGLRAPAKKPISRAALLSTPALRGLPAIKAARVTSQWAVWQGVGQAKCHARLGRCRGEKSRDQKLCCTAEMRSCGFLP